MRVYLLEQSENSVPGGTSWLGPREIAVLAKLRFAKRRADWRLGRWTAKRALATLLKLPERLDLLAQIEILAEASGAPRAFLANASIPLTVSLSHRAGVAICALAPRDARLGCDMERIEPHSAAFGTDYFTAEEQTLLAHVSAADQPRILTLLWSAKESALKALHEGLRLDTRSVCVDGIEGECDLQGWSPLRVRLENGTVFDGWWQGNAWVLRTVVGDPQPDSPIFLEPPSYLRDDMLPGDGQAQPAPRPAKVVRLPQGFPSNRSA